MRVTVQFDYIETDEGLRKAAAEWERAKELAIDLECENNFHHYGNYISIIQISDGRKHWIVDVLRVKDMRPFARIIESPHIQKIFHDVSYDLRITTHQFGCRPRNIFDTQIATVLIGREEIGLGHLMEHFFGVKKEHKYQKADWTRRPLTRDMLDYAIRDAVYLIHLRNILKKELKKLGRMEWAEQEFATIEKRDFSYKEPGFQDIKGIRLFSPRELAILKRLYQAREQMARATNRPIHYIINTKLLKDLAQRPPRSMDEWRRLRGIHPVVRSRAREFFAAVEQGRKEEVRLPPLKKLRLSSAQKDRIEGLNLLRGAIATPLGIKKHLIMSQDQMQDMVVTGKMDSLRPWQRELVLKKQVELARAHAKVVGAKIQK
jgi:ribonuclease D